MPFDDYIVWHSPGFLSITVPYDRTRDFFFSGHTSSLTLLMLEAYTLKFYPIVILMFISLIFMMNMLIISRIHYTIDVIAALVFSLSIYTIVVYNLKYIDYFFSFPLFLVNKIKNKCHNSQSESNTQ